MSVVTHLMTSTGGGAGRAAMRLHDGLRALGVDSRVVCERNPRGLAGVTVVEEATPRHADAQADVDAIEAIRGAAVTGNRTSISNTVFNLAYPGYGVLDLPDVRDADLIHLHWVARLVSPRAIGELAATGKPILWTLHDYWPMTAGCHFPAGCDGYRDSCTGCPQLAVDFGLTEMLLEDKARACAQASIGAIALCEKSMRDARGSRVFGSKPVYLGTNSVDTSAFAPASGDARAALRRAHEIPDDAVVFLNVAQTIREKRKAFGVFAGALRRAAAHDDFRRRAGAGEVVVVSVGANSSEMPGGTVRVVDVNPADDETLAGIMAMSDFLVHPAEEETFGLVTLEAMSCGVVPIVSGAGRFAEILVDGTDGYVLPPGPGANDLARILDRVCASGHPTASMRAAARQRALEFGLEETARSTLAVYAEHTGRAWPAGQAPAAPPAPAATVDLPLDTRLSPFLMERWLPGDLLDVISGDPDAARGSRSRTGAANDGPGMTLQGRSAAVPAMTSLVEADEIAADYPDAAGGSSPMCVTRAGHHAGGKGIRWILDATPQRAGVALHFLGTFSSRSGSECVLAVDGRDELSFDPRADVPVQRWSWRGFELVHELQREERGYHGHWYLYLPRDLLGRTSPTEFSLRVLPHANERTWFGFRGPAREPLDRYLKAAAADAASAAPSAAGKKRGMSERMRTHVRLGVTAAGAAVAAAGVAWFLSGGTWSALGLVTAALSPFVTAIVAAIATR